MSTVAGIRPPIAPPSATPSSPPPVSPSAASPSTPTTWPEPSPQSSCTTLFLALPSFLLPWGVYLVAGRGALTETASKKAARSATRHRGQRRGHPRKRLEQNGLSALSVSRLPAALA